MDIDYKAIGMRIKAARVRKGVTQGNIAKITGLSTPHISNIETGNTKLGLPTIIHLANVLDVSVDELLCDNIHRSERIFHNELSDLLQDCSVDELHIIAELAKVVKKSIYERDFSEKNVRLTIDACGQTPFLPISTASRNAWMCAF